MEPNPEIFEAKYKQLQGRTSGKQSPSTNNKRQQELISEESFLDEM